MGEPQRTVLIATSGRDASHRSGSRQEVLLTLCEGLKSTLQCDWTCHRSRVCRILGFILQLAIQAGFMRPFAQKAVLRFELRTENLRDATRRHTLRQERTGSAAICSIVVRSAILYSMMHTMMHPVCPTLLFVGIMLFQCKFGPWTNLVRCLEP